MRSIHIATAARRNVAKWANETWQWSDLVQRCSKTLRTSETVAEYAKMTRDQQSNIKDVGGFVGGYLTDGKRNKRSVKFRDVICLDVDCGKAGVWDKYAEAFKGVESFAYSTHKHTDAVPRMRIVILLDRSISAEEYEAISRAVAGQVGVDYFDSTTYAPERLMYWPSTSSDGEWFFRHQEGSPLCAEDMLNTYIDWRDSSEWKESTWDIRRRDKEEKKQGDPTEKSGIVGCFCRAYDIHSAIAEYLSDVYEEAGPSRYTYKHGTVSAGLVVYSDGKFAYSHNATDPCSQQLVNAFDLVRIHLFGVKDEDVAPTTLITKRPSFIAMEKLAIEDKEVKKQIGRERAKSIKEDFSGIADDAVADDDWSLEMQVTKAGTYQNTSTNIAIVLENSPEFRGSLWYNVFKDRMCARRRLPWGANENNNEDYEWKNSDDNQLRFYLQKEYGLSGKDKIEDALVHVTQTHKVHPVREYLSNLEWDGTPRLETLFIDFLGVKDTRTARMFTRKHLLAAVARILRERDNDLKHDQILTIVGPEGVGKSTILRKLAGDKWFRDSVHTMEGKDGMEILAGCWILEVAELVAVKKSENEAIKSFLSRESDAFRPAYGKRVQTHERECVFFATTNERSFLKGDTGNRRYWVIEAGVVDKKKKLEEDFTPEYRNQVWAEVVTYYRQGESRLIDKDTLKEALEIQESYNENSVDERISIIKEFLDKRLPADWKTRSIARKQAFFKDCDPLTPDGVIRRDVISNVEIYVECFGMSLSDPKLRYKTREITSLMSRVEGWEKGGIMNQGTEYGKQRIYKRIIKEDYGEEDL